MIAPVTARDKRQDAAVGLSVVGAEPEYSLGALVEIDALIEWDAVRSGLLRSLVRLAIRVWGFSLYTESTARRLGWLL